MKNTSKFLALASKAEKTNTPEAYVINFATLEKNSLELVVELLDATLRLKRSGLFKQLKFILLHGVRVLRASHVLLT